MAQHDYSIANQSGNSFRADLNNGLAAIVSNNSGASEPSTMYAYQWWADTTTGLLKLRNASNSAWLSVGTLASANLGLLASGGTLTAAAGSAGTPSITFTGATTDTGIYSPGTDQVAIATAGNQRLLIDSSGRLLVGTSSFTGEASLAIKASSAGTGTQAMLVLQRGQANPAPDLTLGVIKFTDSDASGHIGAEIAAQSDGGFSWSSGDYPTRLVFSTTADGAASPTEQMRILNTGRSFQISSIEGHFSATTQGAGTTYYIYAGAYSRTTNVSGGTASYYVWSNGNVQNTNNSYTGISDIKLKENIVDASSQWDDLKALQVRNYNFKEGQTHTQIGLIAQEVELVSPGLVSKSPDRDEEGNDLGTVTKSVNYSVLYMKAVKALQEAMERIETLEQRLTDAGIA